MPSTPDTSATETPRLPAPPPASGPDQVVEEISAMIADGVYQPGDRLPSENTLMAEYGVTRRHAREAIQTLVRAGVATTVRGLGTLVRSPDIRRPHTIPRGVTQLDATDPGGQLDGQPESERDGRRDGQYGTELVDTETSGAWETVKGPFLYRIEADPDTALAMVIPERSALFAIDRELTSAPSTDTDPHTPSAPTTHARRTTAPTGPVRVTHRTQIPMAVCLDVPAIADDPTETRNLYTHLAGAGYDLHWHETVRVIPATPDDVTALGATLGGPILNTRRLTTTPDGRTLALEETWRDATTTQLIYVIRPDSGA